MRTATLELTAHALAIVAEPQSLCAVAVIACTFASAGALCQGLVLVEFLMASTRVASVSKQLARARTVINVSMISYIVLSTLLLIARMAGFRALDLGRWGTGGSGPWAVLNTLALTSVGVLVLYASHKIARVFRRMSSSIATMQRTGSKRAPRSKISQLTGDDRSQRMHSHPSL